MPVKCSDIRPIGLSGVARAGKDTFCKLIIKELAKTGVKAKRFALADALKEDLDEFLLRKFGISAFTTSPEEKALIRDILVAYGKTHRTTSKGTYWTAKLEVEVKEAMANGIIPIVTDIRYAYYQHDEVHWIKDKMRGYLVHITRFNESGTDFIQPANWDERDNDPRVQAYAYKRLIIPHVEDPEENDAIQVIVWELLKSFNKHAAIGKGKD